MDFLVTAFFRTDGPWTAAVAWFRFRRVVAALSKGLANGVDRRHVHDVEAHLCDVWQQTFAIGESAVVTRLWSRGTREEFVPRTESRTHRINNNVKFAIRLGCKSLVRIAEHEFVQHRVCCVDPERFWLFAGAQNSRSFAEPDCVTTFCAAGGLGD